MNKLIYIIYFFSISQLFSQNIEKRIGEYKTEMTTYRFSEIKKKIKFRKADYYFDNSGKILEIIGYGRHHYNKLNIIGRIEQFEYHDTILKSSKKYVSWCKSCEFYKTVTKYNYNNKNELTDKITLSNEEDSPILSVKYLKKNDSLEIHSGSTTYIQKIFDADSKILELNQRHENTNKLRWQYLFNYGKNWKQSNFQTFYEDSDNYSKKEIEYFDDKNRIIKREIISSLKTKILYFYSNKGLLKEIKEYENYNNHFNLKFIIKYKFRGKFRKLKQKTINKINKELIGELDSY